MRVLLIRPPVARETIGLKHIMICEPLELEYVAAGLPGHEVQILDMLVERGLDSRLRSFRPDVVGTSCYITGVNEVLKICRTSKAWNRRCITIVGGVHASRAPEDFADESVDCIVLGDGTSVIAPLLRAFQDGSQVENFPGLALPRAPGEVFLTPGREYMPDPDSLPFPCRNLVAHLASRYYYLFHQPVATMKTTWGCPYDCKFCYPCRITDGLTYARSPESIVDELATIQAREVYIVDDIFLMNSRRLAAIAELLRARNIRKNYLVYARADFLANNEEIIEEWAALGLKAVLIGLEATTDPELSTLEKNTTVDHNRRAVALLHKHRVDTYGSFITSPDYTPADWEHLWRFIEETGIYYVNISPLTPLPGTRIWKEYEPQVTVSRKRHELWDLTHCVLPTRMPLKKYYRSLLRVYARTTVDLRRANRLMLRTRPPIWTLRYLRLWSGAVRIALQLMGAHRHHRSTIVSDHRTRDWNRAPSAENSMSASQ